MNSRLNQILGNYIGTPKDGSQTKFIPNQSAGVRFESGAVKSQNDVRGNVLGGNLKGGVVLAPDAGTGIRISANSIYRNDKLGIDLGDNDVTHNDAAPDLDTGPNEKQNFPVVTGAVWTSGNLTISVELTSKYDTDYTLEVFVNDECDPSGYGEGQTPFASAPVHTNPETGMAGIQIHLTEVWPPPTWQFVTATAIEEPDGHTSEFSLCRELEDGSSFMGMSPNSGPAAGGTSVLITGRNFLRISQVLFGATPATTFRVVSPDLIIATAPPGASGVVDVRVSGIHGLSPIVPAGRFTYVGRAPDPGGGRSRDMVPLLPWLELADLEPAPAFSVPVEKRARGAAEPSVLPPAAAGWWVWVGEQARWPEGTPVRSSYPGDGDEAIPVQHLVVSPPTDVSPFSLGEGVLLDRAAAAFGRDAVEQLFGRWPD